MKRQPLRDTAPNVVSTMRRRSSVDDSAKKPRSKLPGIENDQRGSDSPKKKSRVKVLLGGMFQRPSSTRNSDASLQPEALVVAKLYDDKYQHQPSPSKTNDASTTTVLTEMEASTTPLEEMFVVNVRVMEEKEETAPESLTEKERTGATLLQALFRGYRQRYEFQMLLLRLKLQQIKANKERQLQKLEERVQVRKRHECSAFQFEHDKNGRQLQRVARVVPYLFREALDKVRANFELVNTPEQLQELQESHLRLQTLAHSYLDLLEDIPGIWEALKAQWMAPKRPRPRRSFGPDGKIVKVIRRYDTSDELSDEEENPPSVVSRSSFVNLFVQAYAYEVHTTDEDRDEAVEQVMNVVGNTIWN